MRRLCGIAVCCTATVVAGAGAGERTPDERWLKRVADELRSAEYRVSWQHDSAVQELAAAWHAVNRAHDLRAYFDGSGVHVVPR